MFADAVAPDGNRTSSNFARWFSDSQAVTSEGKPLVVFHGTTSDFDAFDMDKSFDGGIHFGTAKAAELRLEYWLEGNDGSGLARVLPFFLTVSNPKRLNFDPYDEESWAQEIEKAKEEGHDGVRYPNSVEGDESWVIFDPGQAKSALFNSGLFDRRCHDFSDTNPESVRAAAAISWLESSAAAPWQAARLEK